MAGSMPTVPGCLCILLLPITHLSPGPEGCNKEPRPLHSHPSLKTIKLILVSCFEVYKSQRDECYSLADGEAAIYFNCFSFSLFFCFREQYWHYGNVPFDILALQIFYSKLLQFMALYFLI